MYVRILFMENLVKETKDKKWKREIQNVWCK